MNQSEHQARAGPRHHHTTCFNERQKHHSNGLDQHRGTKTVVVHSYRVQPSASTPALEKSLRMQRTTFYPTNNHGHASSLTNRLKNRTVN